MLRSSAHLVPALLALIGCQRFTPPTDAVLLPIANRPWAAEAPAEGWCGEASIQMAALHFGAWLPQRLVHELGSPKHVDLWETDMATAMTAAGLKFETWPGYRRSEADFLSWIIDQVRQGHPVIVGVKLLPDTHPEAPIDHLMPVVGFTPAHLVFNTNLEQGQAPVPFAALAAQQGLRLTTPSRHQFGWAVTGLERAGGVSLRVVSESPETVTLEVKTAARVVRQDDLRGTAIALALDGGTVQLPAQAAARFGSTAL